MDDSCFEQLAFLHDALLLDVKYCANDPGGRMVILRVKCDPECGAVNWANKVVEVCLEDVVLLDQFVIGAVVGEERLDSWRSTISNAMKLEAARLSSSEFDCSGQAFTVTFHTGSYIEGICRRIVGPVVIAH